MAIHKLILILALVASALAPLGVKESANKQDAAAFPGWPTHFNGLELVELALDETELRYEANFPGKVARFYDGEREYVMRWVTSETRRLHPVADCLKGNGYTVTPAPILVDVEGHRWGCNNAAKENTIRLVCERIYDEDGNSWSDVSAWYWSAILRRTEGPWWSVAIAF